ncbi:hypothetical protein BVX97_01295 [bacterium E08(2017)]|nr:hypothetical protein BVX97_01295 [bacterium E08(2017)]
MINTDQLLECAIKTATTAGAHALANLDRRTEVVQVSPHDVKLKLDLECQEIAEKIILEAFPDHSFLGEEETADSSQLTANSKKAEYLWIVDPIDGTVNFSHGFPIWCCSVAVQQDGKTVAAAVYAPKFDELFTASADQPSQLNGEPIKVSSTSELEKSMIFTGMDRHEIPGHEPYTLFRRLADNTQKARIAGSAALDLCRVACGQADGYFESDIYTWDIAAAGYIIERAGGIAEVTKKYDNPHQLQYLASNGLIHDKLKTLLEL